MVAAESSPTAESIAQALEQSRGSGNQWGAACPAHEDHNASLSITQTADRVLVRCHAGCTQDAVLDALRSRGLWPAAHPTVHRDTPHHDRQIVATYPYRDAAGVLVYEVVRFQPKDFRQRRPDPTQPGQYLWSLQGITRLPYRLPELLAAVAAGQRIHVCEGEKDAHALVGLGLVATCNTGGAGKWTAALSTHLKGAAEVVVIADRDAPGRAHAQQVAASVAPLVRGLKVLELPGEGVKDAHDWVARWGTAAQLDELVAGAPSWSPAVAAAETTPQPRESILGQLGGFNLSELGNGRRFAAEHRGKALYVVESNAWRVWDGKRWAQEKGTIRAQELAKETTDRIQADAEAQGPSIAKPVKDWVKKCESTQVRKNMLTDAKSEPGMSAIEDDFDADQWALNCVNGTLDLRTGKLRAHDPQERITRLVPVPYADDAPEPAAWLAFLERIFGGDRDLIGYIQRMVGYAMTGASGEDCLFFLYGTGANGKTTFLNVIRSLLSDYSQTMPTEVLMDSKRRSGTPTPDLARLKGARMVVASETEKGRNLAESLVKQLTGRDPIAARYLRENTFEFLPTHKLFLAGNHKPQIRSTDHAIWRRIHLVPFMVTIPEAERDPDLTDKLKAEMPGIFAWAYFGCQWWQHDGLNAPSAVLDAVEEYREEMDVLAEFIGERCIRGPYESVLSNDIYADYKCWAERRGQFPWAQRQFGSEMGAKGFERLKSYGIMRYKGVSLRFRNAADEADAASA